MAIKIIHREVLYNIIRFKDNVLGRSGVRHQTRIYRVFLNCKTGDMRFSGPLAKGEWKELQFVVDDVESLHFKLCDAGDRALFWKDLAPLAERVTQETVAILNQEGDHAWELSSEKLPEALILEDLSQIRRIQAETMASLQGWSSAMSRAEAESKLRDKQVGTFLLRQVDPLLDQAVALLAISNNKVLSACILAALESREKVCEYLILQLAEREWILYNDEPILRRYETFASMEELIRHFGIGRYPV